VFVDALMAYSPPVMKAERLRAFVSEVFSNIGRLAAHHERLLKTLFERQREQHPLVQSVADLVLDSASRAAGWAMPP
jgi:hypothetical protein